MVVPTVLPSVACTTCCCCVRKVLAAICLVCHVTIQPVSSICAQRSMYSMQYTAKTVWCIAITVSYSLCEFTTFNSLAGNLFSKP